MNRGQVEVGKLVRHAIIVVGRFQSHLPHGRFLAPG